MKHPAWQCLEGASIFRGQMAMVTGAASGIGRACALAFARQGADLVLIDVDEKSLEETSKQAGEWATKVLAITADVTKELDLDLIFTRVNEVLGGLDILINNAGGGLPTNFFDTTLEEWERVMRLNLTSVFAISQRAARIFKERQRGAIVNISSLAGRSVSVTAGCHYTSSKAGLLGLTRHMARALAPFKIRVNAVCPGVINSPRILKRLEETGRTEAVIQSIPLGRLGDVSEVAACCVFLASDLAGFVTGATLDANGGALMM